MCLHDRSRLPEAQLVVALYWFHESAGELGAQQAQDAGNRGSAAAMHACDDDRPACSIAAVSHLVGTPNDLHTVLTRFPEVVHQAPSPCSRSGPAHQRPGHHPDDIRMGVCAPPSQLRIRSDGAEARMYEAW